jgi:hypothetical protein
MVGVMGGWEGGIQTGRHITAEEKAAAAAATTAAAAAAAALP